MHKGVILSECEPIPLRERAGEYLMLRLRTVDGVEENEYTRSFLLPFKPLERIFQQLQKSEYAAQTNGRWHLTPKGFMDNVSKKKLKQQEKDAAVAAAKEFEAKKKVTAGEAPEEDKPVSGDPARPYARGRAYSARRYGEEEKPASDEPAKETEE